MQLATLPGGCATPVWCHGRFGLSHIFRKFHQRNPKSSDPVGSNFTSSMGCGNENDTTDFRSVPKNKQALNKFLSSPDRSEPLQVVWRNNCSRAPGSSRSP